MPSHRPPFDWKQLDERLVSLMMSRLAEEFGKLNRDDFQQIHYLNMGNQNGMSASSQRFEMHLLRTEEKAARVYDMYCEVWRCQQQSLSPDFVRAVCKDGIRILISARTSAITHEFAIEQMRTHKHNPQWLKARTESFKHDMERLFTKWQQTAEIDAKSLEYMSAAAPDNPALESVATQLVHARAQLRIAETSLVSIEARITITERALSATQLREPDAYRVKNIEQTLEGLKADKQQLELRLDQWRAKVDAALSRSAELKLQDAPSQLSDQENQAEHYDSQVAVDRNGEPASSTAPGRHPAPVIGPERDIAQARERVRHFEAEIAAVDTKIAAFQQSLTEAIVRGTSRFKPSEIEKAIRKLHAGKKELEYRRDDWQLNLSTALARSAQRVGDRNLAGVGNTKFSDAETGDEREPAKNSVPRVPYASAMKRAIAMLLSIMPDASDLQICRQFDADGMVDLPERWTSGKNRSFEGAYRDPEHRSKIEKTISKVRTDLRKKGLL